VNWKYEAPHGLALSDEGIELLKNYEGEVRGVYNDSSGYATFGIGSLIRKRNSILLAVLKSHKDLAKSHLKTYKPTGAPYVDMTASQDGEVEHVVKDLANKASGDERKQIEEEWRLLCMDWDSDYMDGRFNSDVEAKSAVVRKKLGQTKVTQDQFDTLVSMSYNVAPEAGFWVVLKKFVESDRKQLESKSGTLAQVEACAAAFMVKILAYAHATVAGDAIVGWKVVGDEITKESMRVAPYKSYNRVLSIRRQQEGARILGPRFSDCNPVCTSIRIARASYFIAGENNATKAFDQARKKLDLARAAATAKAAR